LAELDAANLPTDIAAIPTTAMRGTDSAALASVATEARLAELDAANIPADIAAIPTTAMRGTDSANTTTPPTVNAIVDQVWDEAQADHVAVGSFGVTASEIAAIPTTAMRGTDSAALASVATEARLAELDAANLPTDIAAIPTTAMRGTDNVVLAGPTKAEMDTAHALLATEAKQDIIDANLDALIVTVGTAGIGLSNVKLPADGLDLVLVDGKTLPAALQIIGAVVGGKISGAGTGTETFIGLDAATTRVTVTVDGSGNRSAMTYA
jgi:hypothetical protein